MSGSTFTADYSGIRQMLNMDEMKAMVMSRAELVAKVATGIAPVGDDADPHRGEYKAGFDTELNEHGGKRHDRPEGICFNRSHNPVMVPLYVEKGTSDMEGEHVLLRALSAATLQSSAGSFSLKEYQKHRRRK